MRLSLIALTGLVWTSTSCGDRPSPVEPASGVAPRVSAAGGRPIDATFSFEVDAGVYCDFAFRIEASEKEKAIALPGGRTLLLFPGAVYTVTNLDNGNQETFRIPGSFHVTNLENDDVETVFTGRNIIGLTPDPRFLVLAIGTFSYVFDPQGNLVQPLEGDGQLIDVCELLG
jgi:hypothetical protein